eukprot:jgi/Chlat1/6952/Chrsp52S06642
MLLPVSLVSGVGGAAASVWLKEELRIARTWTTLLQLPEVLPNHGVWRPGKLAQDAESSTSTKRKDAEVTMKQKKAWEAATAPMKQILMMGFMMWMAGSTVHIFSIMITATAIWQPLQAIRGAPALFKRFKDPKVDTFSCQAVYILCNLAACGIGLFKLNTLGLLPTSASDWISDAVPQASWHDALILETTIRFRNNANMQALEISGGGIPLSLH